MPIGIAFACLVYMLIAPKTHHLDHALSAYVWNPYLGRLFGSGKAQKSGTSTLETTPTMESPLLGKPGSRDQ